jgi:hypothetical protein
MIHPVVLAIFDFGNAFNYIVIAICVLVGILVGIFLRPLVGNTIMKIIPSENRFVDFDIEEETAISIYCKNKKGIPPHRFIKCWPGYIGVVGRFLKKPITRFIGREGTAYTWHIKDQKEEKIGSLAKTVKHLWGEEFYETIPEKQKKDLEESMIGVTVKLESEDALTPAGMRTVSEENIKQDDDIQASKTFWKGKKITDRGAWINLILGIGTGFGICATLVLLGIFRAPASEPAATPAPEIAQMIWMALMKLVM